MEQNLLHGLKADFTVGSIAEKLHVSSRHLQRAFAGGELLSVLLLKHRVFNARTLLIAPDFAHLTYLEVARRCGFSDTRALRRAVLAVLGARPADISRGAS